MTINRTATRPCQNNSGLRCISGVGDAEIVFIGMAKIENECR